MTGLFVAILMTFDQNNLWQALHIFFIMIVCWWYQYNHLWQALNIWYYRLATETSLTVLSTLLLDWLEHLKTPLIDKVAHSKSSISKLFLRCMIKPEDLHWFQTTKIIQSIQRKVHCLNWISIFRTVWSILWYFVRILKRRSSDSMLTRFVINSYWSYETLKEHIFQRPSSLSTLFAWWQDSNL